MAEKWETEISNKCWLAILQRPWMSLEFYTLYPFWIVSESKELASSWVPPAFNPKLRASSRIESSKNNQGTSIYFLSSKPWFNREMSNQFIDRMPPTPARALSSRHPLLMGQGLNLWCMETLCISTRHCLCVFAETHTSMLDIHLYIYIRINVNIYIYTCIYYISTRMSKYKHYVYIYVCVCVCMYVCR